MKLDAGLCKVCTDVIGFYFNPKNSTDCIEVCGDGMNFGLPCDDSNNINGDGCSSNCQVEFGYKCIGGNSTSPDRCLNKKPITYGIFEVDADKSFYNLNGNANYYFQIEFNKGFTLPEGKTLADYIAVSIEGHSNDPFSISAV